MTALTGVRVVVTRPADRAQPLADGLRNRGAEVVAAPATEVQEVDSGELAAAFADLAEEGDNRWLIAASASAVAPTVGALGHLGGNRSLRVAAVGPATAAGLIEAGLVPEVVGDGTGADLAQRLIALADIGRAVIPSAAEPRPELAAQLRAAGWHVDQPPAYRTVPLELPSAQRPLVEGADLVTVAAPSAVRAVSAWSPAVPPLVCIGPTTAAEAADRGLRVAATAERPTVDGLIEAVCQAVARHGEDGSQ